MSKQRRPPERRSQGPASQVDTQRESGEQDVVLSNQDLRDALVSADGVDLDLVREIAAPLVSRSILALQMFPQPGAQLDRFVHILENSRLPDDRKAVLVDRLRTDQAVATSISDAVERWFPGDSETLRATLTQALLGIEGALQREDLAGVSPSEEARSGSTSARAEALVRDVADALAGDALTGLVGPEASVGAAVQGLCRTVQLVLLWDEEEEEETATPGDYAAEESGA